MFLYKVKLKVEKLFLRIIRYIIVMLKITYINFKITIYVK